MPDDNPQQAPATSYERARLFIVASWILRFGWFFTVWTFVLLGWVLFAISACLDALIPRPRPQFAFFKTRVSNWILLFAFATSVLGMLVFKDIFPLFLTFGVVAGVVILFEAFHYARADMEFLRSLRDVDPHDHNHTSAAPEKRTVHNEEQLPLL